MIVKPIYAAALLAVLLAPPTALPAAKPVAALADQQRMPVFSWDHVPLYVHIRKDTAFTDEEIRYLATFPLITFEKATGHSDSGSMEAGTLKAARAVKAINPATKILYYRNVDADETPRSATRNTDPVRRGRDAKSRFDYQLAMFLICAEKYSYFDLKDSYDAKTSKTWMTHPSAYDRPLGAPKGPAARDGYTYTREFVHASVRLDIEQETGEIVWKDVTIK